MAKRREEEERDSGRRSRKEILIERKRQRQTRQLRIGVIIVVSLLLLVLVFAIVNEYVIRPRQPVAQVGEVEIAMADWQDRVRFQRAQFIISLEDQLEAFQDVGLVQQFSQQQLSLLTQPELLGELVLEQMIDEELVRQAAIQRTIRVTDEDVDELIAEQFNYFGGAAPTPLPTPTETIEPTPSLTPIPTAVITEVVPTTTPMPTAPPGPTATARPTATPVSEEAFQEEFSNLMDRYRDKGVSEETYRDVLRAQLYRQKLGDQLAEVENLPSEAEHASLYLLRFDSEEAAQNALDLVEEEGFLEVWNRMRSLPVDAEERPEGTATEILWRPQDQLEQQVGAEVAQAAFDLPLETPSAILVQTTTDETGAASDSYYIIMVSGREVRDLTEAAIENQKNDLVAELISTQRELTPIERFPRWRTRVPTQPVLDPAFLVPPTQPAAAPLATPTG